MIRANIPDFGRLTKQCLRGELTTVLEELRSVPKEQVDRSFLQFYLGQSTRLSHWPSIAFVWNGFVVRRNLLVVRPHVLTEIARISMLEKKSGFTRSVLKHYNRYYVSEQGIRWDGYRYLLLNAHIEMYAKKPNSDVGFKKKWHAYVVEIDNTLVNYPVDVFDFPSLTASLQDIPFYRLRRWLLHDCREGTMNQRSIPMLLNMILLQSHVTQVEKADLFKELLDKSLMDSTRHFQDTLRILMHECDPILLHSVLEKAKSLNMTLNEKTKRSLLKTMKANSLRALENRRL